MSLSKTTGKTAAALRLTLLAVGFAHAQELGWSGSIDIYSTNFQKTL